MNLPQKDKEGKQYVSYSQISTWTRSKRDYIRQKFFGEGYSSNAYTDFGNLIGKALETNCFDGFTEEEVNFLKTIPRYDVFEKEVHVDMGDYYVLCFIDTATQDLSKIADYKTGEIAKKVSDYSSEEYLQLDIYAAGCRQETGKLPECVDVHLIDRKGNAFAGEELKLGDKFETIKRPISVDTVATALIEVNRAAREISQYYEVFLKLKELKS